MSDFLNYLLKSTLSLSLLYLLFRAVMRKERFFALNRMLLLAIVVAASVIPVLYSPAFYQSPVQVDLLPVFAPPETGPVALADRTTETTVEKSAITGPEMDKVSRSSAINLNQLIEYLYFAGLAFSFLFLLRGLSSILMLFRKAKSIKMDGCRLLVVDREIPAFSFGRLVVLSKHDYEEHRETLLAHEQAHIRLNHFFDLVLLEAIKILHWFNPVIYWMAKDLKEIHEFQADDYTLTNGIDVTQYQLLIIQKGVGSQKFALANSFNHCQIKKRITMMNNQKSTKTRSWKVATFLPLLALLLMAFGRQSENVMDLKEIQNPVSQKIEEKQSIQNGINREQLAEYENIVSKVFDNKGVPELRKISETDKKRLETLYLSMNAEQRAAQMVIFIPAPPPLPKAVPTVEQMKTWEDAKIYGLWINAKRVSNSDLKNYTNNDFTQFFVSKLEKITINYGKHYYQVNLMTNEYYANYLARRESEEKYGIATRKKKEGIKLKGANDIDAKANFKALDSIQSKLYVVDGVITDQRRANYFMEVGVESITILKGKDAIKKYGEKAKNGVVEIILKKENVKESNKMSTENFELIHADEFVTNSQNPTIMYFYNAQIKFNEGKLNADYIEINKDSSLIYATGRPDSTGTIVGKPVLTLGNQKISANEIRYNYETKKGIIYNIGESKKF